MKRAFELKQKAFFIIFKGLSIAKNCLRPESAPLNQLVFQENKICNFKIHLISILNTKQTNDSIFSNKAEENFNLAKIL